jgi:uncharacterized zinc-type alcohol dehydrogenase-like protein
VNVLNVRSTAAVGTAASAEWAGRIVTDLGGLGHLVVKMATALVTTNTVISRTPSKAEEARSLGAQGVVVSIDPLQMQTVRDQFDVLIDTTRPGSLPASGRSL